MARLSTDTIFADVVALQQTTDLDDSEVARLVRSIAQGDELEGVAPDAVDVLYRLAWVTHIRTIARDQAGLVMSALQWDLVESGSMTLEEVRESVALTEPGHHGWIMLDGAQANLGVLWERSANAFVEVARYTGANLRLFVDVPLADFRAARQGQSPELHELSDAWSEASNRARQTLERGDLLADYLPPGDVAELRVRLDQLATWNMWEEASDALTAYIQSEHAIESWRRELLWALIELNLDQVESAIARLDELDLNDVDSDGQVYLLGVARDLWAVDLERAVEFLETIPRPGRDVLADLATGLWELGDAEAALEAVDRALDIDAEDVGMHMLRARLLYSADSPDALAAYDEVLGLQPDHPDALSERGTIHLEQGRLEDALADFEDSLLLDPEHGPTRMSRARTLDELGRGLEALGDVERLTTEQPYQDVLGLYARLAEAAGRTNSAMTAHLKVLRHAGERNATVETSLERLEALGYEGPISFPWPIAPSQRIERFFLQGLEPDDADRFRSLRDHVFHANREGRTRDALYAAEELIELLPGFFESWVTRGSVFLSAGYYEDALADAAEAMRLSDAAESPYLLAYECYRGLGQGGDAVAAIQDAVTRDPMSAQLHFALGVGLEAVGEIDQALEALRESLRLSPGLHDARFNLGRLLDESGASQDALNEYEEILREAPDDAETRVNMATAYVKLDDFEAARAHLLEAVGLRPEYLFAHQKLALVLQECDEPGRSAAHFCIAFALAEELILESNEFRQRFDEMTTEGVELDVEYLRTCVVGLQDVGLYDEAHAAVSNLELLGSQVPEYWLLRSESASLTSGDWATDASHAARRAAALRSDDPRVHFQLVRTAQDDPKTVVDHTAEMLEHSEQLDDDEFVAKLGELVDVLVKSEPFEREAVELLVRAEKLVEERSADSELAERLLFRRAWLQDRIGDRDASIEDYSRCLELNPDEATYWFNRACEYGIEGRADEAVSDLERAIQLNERWRARAADEEYFDPIRADDAFQQLMTK